MWQLYVTSDHHFAKNQYLDPPRSTLIIDYEIMIQWSMMDHAGKGNQKIIPFPHISTELIHKHGVEQRLF